MSDQPEAYRTLSADGHSARWTRWQLHDSDLDDDQRDADQRGDELTLSWDNEAWTASGLVSSANVQFVIRISPVWHVRQFLLFRDLDEPDLWLGNDGRGRWGEVNGAHRPELDGCVDISLDCTPFTSTIPIRRLGLRVAEAAEIIVAAIDVETLDVQAQRHRYSRLGTHRWKLEQLESGDSVEFDVDEFGLAIDYPSTFRRMS